MTNEQQSSQQQGDNRHIAIGTSVTASVVISGDGNTVTRTEINYISVDEVKTRRLNTTSPYKGLKPFKPEDSNYFFGRSQFLAGLVNELETTNFILLLGASGSGKSSVMGAGLVPWLQQKWGNQFVSLTFTPDDDPFDSLYSSLLTCRHRYKQSEAKMVRAGDLDTLTQVVDQLKPPESFWLIFIDQFEELFTRSDPEKRDCFITNLVKLSQERAADPFIKIVATMRADFLGQLDPAPANQLANLTQQHRPLITQMQPDELRLAIEQPAAQHGVVFEQGLVEIIIKDVQGQAGCLPFLQYTLNLLWEQEAKRDAFVQERELQTQTYLDSGGVRGALQQHVDQIYASFTENEQAAVQKIFLKLVEISKDESSGTEWKPVRRRAARSEFSDEAEKKVLTQLINENLLVSDASGNELEQRQLTFSDATVEIAHEILLTSWETLNRWIKENRQAIALRNRLYDDVRVWIKDGRRDDELWTGAKLERVNQLRVDTTFDQVAGSFSLEAVDFIDASNSLGKRKMQERIAAGDDRRSALMELLESCTVRLSLSSQDGVSTGFFVAPGKILTSAPEIVGAGEQPIRVDWQDQENFSEATIDRVFQANHLAILKLSSPASHPCVYLDKIFQINDPLCTYGHSHKLAKDGYAVGNCQKQTGRQVIEFKTHQNSLELQSSALLNWKTLKVCGIVQSTHDYVSAMPDQDDVTVGKATSAATILATVQDLKKEQKAFHQKDRRWSNLFPPRCKPRTVALASLGIAVLVTLIRAFQVFQPIEFGFYDALIQNQLNPPKPSNRFLIITVTKQDAEAQENRGEVLNYSLSNRTLVNLLNKIKTLDPVAIGFDIYREQSLAVQSTAPLAQKTKSTLNVRQNQISKSAFRSAPVVQQTSVAEPDQDAKQQLSDLFKEPNLFTVCKGDFDDSKGISPPPGVTPDRVGFSDISVDSDRILRRQLLAFTPEKTSRCQSNKSFSLLVAENYLKKMEKIETTVSDEDCQIKFSNGVALPAELQPNTGGYQGYSGSTSKLFNGCQVLLNYQAPSNYKFITLEEFLSPNWSNKDYSRRIVLIGIKRSDGISDNLRTPFDQGPDQITPGVIVQAEMIDQILNVATNKDRLIWVLAGGVDKLLILVFALVGGGVGWWLTSLRQLGIFIVVSCGTVLVISFAAFQFRGWVPLMPQFLALSAAGSCVYWANLRLQVNPPKLNNELRSIDRDSKN